MAKKYIDKLQVLIYVCERCGFEWESILKDRLPLYCPNCKTPYWNKKRKKKK